MSISPACRTQAYLILAVVAGAGIGHYIFGSHMDADFVINGHPDGARDVACH
jgi:copper transporter 1